MFLLDDSLSVSRPGQVGRGFDAKEGVADESHPGCLTSRLHGNVAASL